MQILDPNQFAVLQGVGTGRYLGAEPFDDLRAEVALMLELRLIEPSGACPYRLTATGAKILAIATSSSSPV